MMAQSQYSTLNGSVKKLLPARIKKDDTDSFALELIDKPVRVSNLSHVTRMGAIDVDVPPAHKIAEKRYVTTCYFQPKQIPVSYSETMILKIGSTKKRYFESVYYETKVIPSHWSETMYAKLRHESDMVRTETVVPREDEYLSLEPQQQQAAAATKSPPRDDRYHKLSTCDFLNGERMAASN